MGGAFAADPWRIVILPGADPTQPATMLQDRAFRRTLEAAAPNGVEFYTDPLDDKRFLGGELAPEFLALLTKKYQRREVDLVVGMADFALDFTERHHQQLWPGKPVLIFSVEEQKLRRRGLPAEFAYLPWRIDIDGTLSIAEALQPQARRLVVVAGSTPFDLHWAQRAVQTARQRPARQWLPEIWSGLPMAELRHRLAGLDRNTAVLYSTMHVDREGRSYFPYEVVKPLVEASPSPVYSWYPTYLDNGLTAGSLLSFEDNGRRAGELAVSILRGKTPVAGATLPPTASRCVANATRLEALGLDQDALPAGCLLAHRPPSLWRDYRGTVIGGMTLLGLQACTIGGLLMHRHRRRLAEEEAARGRLELHRAARVATAGELSASIAHEVGQPLSAIVTNTEAAELMLASGTYDVAELHTIFTDVRRDAMRANEVVRRLRALLNKQSAPFAPLDLKSVLDEAMEFVAVEARRRGIGLQRSFLEGSAPLLGDRIQLQQVLLNLAINAMDAMHDTAVPQRVVSVSLRTAANGFELEVADRGHGFSADTYSRLFESFFTTKPNGMGMGLSIVRTIVNSHGGRAWATPRPGGGSLFMVWLPRSAKATGDPVERAESRAATADKMVQWPVCPPGEHP